MPNSDKISSKDKIIEAAIIHLNREGLNNFTATSLTRSANLGYGTFYKYFSSTEDVLESAIKKNVMDWSLMISESNKKEPDRLLANNLSGSFLFDSDIIKDQSITFFLIADSKTSSVEEKYL